MAEITDLEHVQIGAWVFATPACILDGEDGGISGMLSVPTVVGDDRDVPGIDGEAVRRRKRGPIWRNLPVVVFGDVDKDGVPYASARLGLIANLDEMFAAIMPPSDGSPTRLLVHHLEDGSVRMSDCIVTGVDGPAQVGPHVAKVGLTVKIPSGAVIVVPAESGDESGES